MRSLYLPIVIIVLALWSCKTNTKDTESSGVDSTASDQEYIVVAHDQFEQAGMKLGKLDEQSILKTIQTTGEVHVPPQYSAKVAAKMGGFVKETALLEGDHVNKGQFLVSIENPEFIQIQQSYLQIKERLNYLESEYERQKTLFDEKIISEKSYLKAESDFKSAKANLTGLRKQLELLNISVSNVEKGTFTSTARIYAPIGGKIAEINISKGSPVSPETIILEIVDNSHLHIELAVFEKDILYVKEGQTVNFKIPEANARVHEAEVYLVGSTIEPNRTVLVHSHPKDETLTLLTGMFVSADIVIDSVKAKVLPNTAFIDVEDRHYLLKLKNKSDSGYEFETVAVSLSDTNAEFSSFEEIANFNPEDLFLIKGGYALIGE